MLSGSSWRDCWQDRNELCKLAQVLGCGRQVELVLCTVGTSKAQAIELEDAFEMGEQHLDLFSLAPGRDIGIGLGEVPCQVARAFMD